MFSEKRTSIYDTVPNTGQGSASPKFNNIFEREQFKNEHQTYSGNMSVKYTTTGNPFVDDFALIANYRNPRTFEEVSKTMQNLYWIDPLLAIKESTYIRLITRNSKLFTGKKLSVQRGQGLKAEFFMRLVWLATKHPDVFKKNLPVFVVAGSWDDIFEILRLDLEYHGAANRVLDWKFIIKFIVSALGDKDQCNLIKKYLPQIKPVSKCLSLRSQCNNFIAKKIVKAIFDLGETEADKQRAYRAYRKLKASGTAHQWQQAISRQDYENLNFNTIAGRALSALAKGKFLQNHGLEEAYEKWLASKPVAKYTGFVYELFPDFGYSKPSFKKYQEETINKQFMQLIETAKQDMNRETRLIAVLDTSGSMTAKASGLNVSAYHVAKSIGLYLSHLLTGAFSNTVLEFSNSCKIKSWKGDSPVEQFYNYHGDGWCGTNLLSVANLLVHLKRTGYKEEDFPTGIVCISDGEFNGNHKNSPIFTQFRNVLRTEFSEEFVDKFVMVLWDIPNGYYGDRIRPKFESLCDEGYTFYMSGFDPAGIAFLTGQTAVESIPRNAEELFQVAMNQDLLNMLTL